MLQDTIQEQKMRLDGTVRDNALLHQEVEFLKSAHGSQSDDVSSRLSEELKAIESTAAMRENSKTIHKLSKDVESLQLLLTQKSRLIEELTSEKESLSIALSSSRDELNRLRLSDAKYQAVNKLKQLDRDEELEMLKAELLIQKSKLSVLEDTYHMKEDELSNEKVMNHSLQMLLQKLSEKEETNEFLIKELKRTNTDLCDEKLGVFPIETVAVELQTMLMEASDSWNTSLQMQDEKCAGFLVRINNCFQNLNHLGQVLRRLPSRVRKFDEHTDPPMKLQFLQDEVQKLRNDNVELRKRSEHFESKFLAAEVDDSQTLKSMLLVSEKKLEQMSAEYAKNFAQNSKVFAFLESECLRLRNLCDHLRGVNGKLTSEMKKATLYQIKNKGCEQKIRMLIQNEAILLEKCSSLEYSLKQSNDDFLKRLRDTQEKDLIQFRLVENETETSRQKVIDLEQSCASLHTANTDLNRRLAESSFQFENEKKILKNKLELAVNESLVYSRRCSEYDIEIKSLRDKVDEQNLTIAQFEIQTSLISEEAHANELNFTRTTTDLKLELQDKSRKIETLSSEVQKSRMKLLEAETGVMRVNEEYSNILLKSSEKDDKISQLTKAVDQNLKQTAILTEENLKLRSDNMSRSHQLQELTKQVENLTVTYNSALLMNREFEDSARYFFIFLCVLFDVFLDCTKKRCIYWSNIPNLCPYNIRI
jgi:chromosome segregation ATPase